MVEILAIRKTKTAKERTWNPKHKNNQRKRRPYPVVVFLSEEELENLQSKWKNHGFENRADYIRFVLMQGVVTNDTIMFHVDAGILKERDNKNG